MQIKEDDLTGGAIINLLEQHLRNMHEITPAGNVFALDLSGLKAPEISFWSVWTGSELMGCGALKELDKTSGEIKSMRTADAHLRKGVAAKMLNHILKEAKRREYQTLYLETGSFDAFKPARALYERYGFSYTEPFGDYELSPHNIFMKKEL